MAILKGTFEEAPISKQCWINNVFMLIALRDQAGGTIKCGVIYAIHMILE